MLGPMFKSLLSRHTCHSAAKILALCLSLYAGSPKADTYPAPFYYQAGANGLTSSFFGPSESAAEHSAMATWSTVFYNNEWDGQLRTQCGDTPYVWPPTGNAGGCYQFHARRINPPPPSDFSWSTGVFIGRGLNCPAGGTLVGTSCTDAPACGKEQTRDPQHGRQHKQRGKESEGEHHHPPPAA